MVKQTQKLEIRTKPWYLNKGLSLDQKIIEESVKNGKLENCPVCKSELKNEDDFGNPLKRCDNGYWKIDNKYCSSCNYIIELSKHHWHEWDGPGTSFFMKIYTNSKYSKLIADSGVLAKIEGRHI